MSNAAELEARIEEHGLAQYVEELDEQGYAVVPPEVTCVTEEQVDELTRRLLEKSEALVGCAFSVEDGPECKLDYGDFGGVLERFSGARPSQFQLMQLCTYHRAFRDLAVNPVAVTLMHHLFGTAGPFGSGWPARFSSHNCFVKWAGDGYGDSLGLHVDQGGIPLPWGDRALNANCNWCLTDYTLDDGAFACVPGSHRRKCHPKLPDAASEAIPVECPRGSVIAFHGALWHGAYPKKTPGLRVTIANFFRHQAIAPQDDIPNHFPKALADDCADPETFRMLAGFGSPYQSQVYPLPKAVRREPSAGEASPTADAQGSAGNSPIAGGVLPCREPSAGEASPTADAQGSAGNSPIAGGVLPCREPSAGEASPTADAQGSAGNSPIAGGVLPCREPSAGEASPTADAQGSAGNSPIAGGVLPCREPSAGEASPTADAQGSTGIPPIAGAYLHGSDGRGRWPSRLPMLFTNRRTKGSSMSLCRQRVTTSSLESHSGC